MSAVTGAWFRDGVNSSPLLSSQVRHSLAFIIIHGLIDYSTPKQQTRYPNCSSSSKTITKVKLAVLVL